jgi:hypothetical protein
MNMKAWSALASATILIALAGCNQLSGGGNANNSTSNAASNASGGKDGGGNSTEAASAESTGGKDAAGATPASSGAPTLDRSFLVGRWTDNGDCSDVIEFTQDGRFIAANGGGGLWNLDGDRLTMTGRATATIRITPIDNDTMTVINTDGSLGRSTRC